MLQLAVYHPDQFNAETSPSVAYFTSHPSSQPSSSSPVTPPGWAESWGESAPVQNAWNFSIGPISPAKLLINLHVSLPDSLFYLSFYSTHINHINTHYHINILYLLVHRGCLMLTLNAVIWTKSSCCVRIPVLLIIIFCFTTISQEFQTSLISTGSSGEIKHRQSL